jgi:hypothetical protein
MRKLSSALLFAVTMLFVPVAAHAAIVELSLGKGGRVKPDAAALPLNLMVAPGISFPVVKLQVGLVADVPDIENSKWDIGVRPMLTIAPPVLPLYARLILAVNNITHSELRSVAYGGAVGLSISLAGVGVFAEAGLLPRNHNDSFQWVVEGRAGLSLDF